MKIDFSSPVIRHCFSLRCLPFDTPSQRIELINVDIEPHNMLTETADGFGNRVLTDSADLAARWAIEEKSKLRSPIAARWQL